MITRLKMTRAITPESMPTVDGTEPAEGASRTDRRRARTQSSLVAAARELIAEKGVGGLRIGEITDRADVALGSFYNYFESKEDVVEAIVAETIGDLAGALGGFIGSADDPAEAVSVSNRRFIRLAYDEPQLAWLLVNLDRAEARFETMVLPTARDALERGIESGRFDVADVGVALTATVGGTLAVMRGILEGRLAAGADASAAEGLLRSLGLDRDTAREIAGRDLPELA
jgi:AcrR family transcriptional regulator